VTAPAPAPFVVGVERSGTTLLRLMLDSHPALAIPFETHFTHKLAAAPGGLSPQAFLDLVTASPSWPNLGVERAALAAAVTAMTPFSAAEGARAFYRLAAAGKPRWGDKTPSYLRSMPAIARLLPEARFVHIIRDGRDAAISSRGLWFGLGGDPTQAARAWADQIGRARKDARALPHYLEARYEDLVLDPEATLRRICAFVELPYDAAMLGYHRTAAARLAEVAQPFGRGAADLSPEAFVAIHARTQAPPDAGRIGRWRREMPAADVRRFERVAGRLLAALGYETGTAR
jgi:hypothetical protein